MSDTKQKQKQCFSFTPDPLYNITVGVQTQTCDTFQGAKCTLYQEESQIPR